MTHRPVLIGLTVVLLNGLPVVANAQLPAERATVDSLRKLLLHADSAVRQEAAFELGQLGRTAAPAVPDLITRAESDQDSRTRWMSVRALGWIGPEACAVLPRILALADDRDQDVRGDVISALSGLGLGCAGGRFARAVLDTLGGHLQDREWFIRRGALEALGELGSRATPHVESALRHVDDTLASRAAQLLGHGEESTPTMRALRSALGDSRQLVRTEVAHALAGFGESQRPGLVMAATSDSATVREGANEALRYLNRAMSSPVADRCFRLELTPWERPLDLTEDTVFTSPPRTVRFSLVKYAFERAGTLPSMRVEPIHGLGYSIHGPGSWQPSRDSVKIVWSTGFSGLTMSLLAGRDTLTGTASTFWDFDRERQTSRVRGVSVPCARR